MAGDLSARLVSELASVVRARQAYLAMRIASYCEATWSIEPVEGEPDQRIRHDQIRDLLELVIEAFEDINGELQGTVEIDAALLTRGRDALRRALDEDDA